MLTWPQRPPRIAAKRRVSDRFGNCLHLHVRPGRVAGEAFTAVLESVDWGDMAPDDVGVIVVDNRPAGQVRALCEQVGARLQLQARMRRGSAARDLVRPAIVQSPEASVPATPRHSSTTTTCLSRIGCGASLNTQRRTHGEGVLRILTDPGRARAAGLAARHALLFRPPEPNARNRCGFRPGLVPTTCWPRWRPWSAAAGPDGPFLQEFAHSGGEDSGSVYPSADEPGLAFACAFNYDRDAHLGTATLDPARLSLAED